MLQVWYCCSFNMFPLIGCWMTQLFVPVFVSVFVFVFAVAVAVAVAVVVAATAAAAAAAAAFAVYIACIICPARSYIVLGLVDCCLK